MTAHADTHSSTNEGNRSQHDFILFYECENGICSESIVYTSERPSMECQLKWLYLRTKFVSIGLCVARRFKHLENHKHKIFAVEFTRELISNGISQYAEHVPLTEKLCALAFHLSADRKWRFVSADFIDEWNCRTFPTKWHDKLALVNDLYTTVRCGGSN